MRGYKISDYQINSGKEMKQISNEESKKNHMGKYNYVSSFSVFKRVLEENTYGRGEVCRGGTGIYEK